MIKKISTGVLLAALLSTSFLSIHNTNFKTRNIKIQNIAQNLKSNDTSNDIIIGYSDRNFGEPLFINSIGYVFFANGYIQTGNTNYEKLKDFPSNKNLKYKTFISSDKKHVLYFSNPSDNFIYLYFYDVDSSDVGVGRELKIPFSGNSKGKFECIFNDNKTYLLINDCLYIVFNDSDSKILNYKKIESSINSDIYYDKTRKYIWFISDSHLKYLNLINNNCGDFSIKNDDSWDVDKLFFKGGFIYFVTHNLKIFRIGTNNNSEFLLKISNSQYFKHLKINNNGDVEILLGKKNYPNECRVDFLRHDYPPTKLISNFFGITEKAYGGFYYGSFLTDNDYILIYQYASYGPGPYSFSENKVAVSFNIKTWLSHEFLHFDDFQSPIYGVCTENRFIVQTNAGVYSYFDGMSKVKNATTGWNMYHNVEDMNGNLFFYENDGIYELPNGSVSAKKISQISKATIKVRDKDSVLMADPYGNWQFLTNSLYFTKNLFNLNSEDGMAPIIWTKNDYAMANGPVVIKINSGFITDVYLNGEKIKKESNLLNFVISKSGENKLVFDFKINGISHSSTIIINNVWM